VNLKQRDIESKRKRILIADCDSEVLIALESILENAGFDVTTVWTVAQALRQMDTRAFHLVLVGDRLPGGSYEHVPRAIRRLQPEAAVIGLLTSTPGAFDAKTLREEGFHCVLMKFEHQHVVDFAMEFTSRASERRAA